VHAVQLPYDEVVSKFCANHVTGYDFAELVENNGNRLETELGITNSRHRNKIMSLVNARMLGIESSLPKVQLDTPLFSCNRVTLRWKEVKSGSGYPVHKYRIQRLTVPKEGGRGGRAGGRGDLSVVVVRGSRPCKDDYLTKLAVNWVLMYEGNDSEYIDYSVEAGFDYTYRIEAWNAVGRSPWVKVVKEEKWWKRCNKTSRSDNVPPNDDLHTLSKIQMFFYFCSSIKFLFCYVTMIMGFMFKLQRGNVSLCKHHYFTTVKEFANKVSRYIMRFDIIPDHTSGTVDMHRYSRNGLDGANRIVEVTTQPPIDRYSRNGLDGANRIVEVTTQPPIDNPVVSQGNTELPITLVTLEVANDHIIPSSDVSRVNSVTDAIKKKKKKGLKQISFRRIFRNSKSSSNISLTGTERCHQSLSESCINYKTSHCHICEKRYKLSRRRHTCSRCNVTFCGEHGKCSHIIGTPCRVPGKCVCDKCLMLSSRSLR